VIRHDDVGVDRHTAFRGGVLDDIEEDSMVTIVANDGRAIDSTSNDVQADSWNVDSSICHNVASLAALQCKSRTPGQPLKFRMFS